jgi:hypothetical protein
MGEKYQIKANNITNIKTLEPLFIKNNQIIFLLPLVDTSSDTIISSFFFNGNFSKGGHDDFIQFFQFVSRSRSFFITMENLGPFGGVFCEPPKISNVSKNYE